ncbi:MAG: hypothetical protein ABIH46_14130 [Chloroflexota bacterium]
MGKQDRLRKAAIRAGTVVAFKDQEDVWKHSMWNSYTLGVSWLNCVHCGALLRIPRDRTVGSSEEYLELIIPQHAAGCRTRNYWEEREYATT